mgnify:CR=1 FL=1
MLVTGKVISSLELRDLDAEKIQNLFLLIEKRAAQIAMDTGVDIIFKPIDATADPALMDQRIQEIIKKNAIKLGYTYKTLPSGAGHDAQDMALIAPTGMIFVPSVNGISHAPEEYSTPQAIAKGVNLLLHSILEIDSTSFN